MSAIVPAVLPSSREDLEDKLALLAGMQGVTRVQIDAVDGKFASPASWPFSAKAKNGWQTELEAMAQNGGMFTELDRIEYEVDLMCFDAVHTAGEWIALGVSRVTFHAGSAIDLARLIDASRQRYGEHCVSFGLSIDIESDLSLIEPYISQISYVQLMGISNIGKQGQAFDPRVFKSLRIFHATHPELPLQVDGGVSLGNAEKLMSLGASSLIVGSSILRARDPGAAFSQFDKLHAA